MFTIGERINGMYKRVGEAIREKDADYIQKLARRQVRRGADALDICVGPVSSDSSKDMEWLIKTVRDAVGCPLCIDSPHYEVLKKNLPFAGKNAIINSAKVIEGSLEKFLHMAGENQASLIILAMDEKGAPPDFSAKVELAMQAIMQAEELGFPAERIFLDPLLLPLKAAQGEIQNTLEAIKNFKILKDPPPHIIVGLSNLSQQALYRSLINRTFLAVAAGAGLDSAILDPLDEDLMAVVKTVKILLNEEIYCDSFLEA